MVSRLWTGTTDPNASAEHTTADRYHGVKFHVSAAGYKITGVRWYRYSTSTPGPNRLRLVDLTNGAFVYGPVVQDDGATGWKTCSLPDMQLTSGVNYVLYADWPSGADQAYRSTTLTPDSPLVFDGHGFGNGTSPTGAATFNDTTPVGLDVNLEVATGTEPPAGSGSTATDALLAAWLSSDAETQTHETDGLPYLTKSAVDAVQGDVTAALANLDNVTAGDVTTYGLSGRSIGAAVTWLLANVNTALDLATKLHNLLSANGTGGDTYDYHGALEDVRQKVYDIEARQLAQLQPPAPASWVSQGTQAFDTDLAWAQEGDVYTITYSSTGSAVVNSYPSGVDVAYRVLWWAVWDGERMRDRRFADGVLPVLYDGGARMPGIVLHSTAGASGTVEAWTLS